MKTLFFCLLFMILGGPGVAQESPRENLRRFYQKLDKDLESPSSVGKILNHLNGVVTVGEYSFKTKDLSFHPKDLKNGRFKKMRQQYLDLKSWDETYRSILPMVINLPMNHFEPEAVVLQQMDPSLPDYLVRNYSCQDIEYINTHWPLFFLKLGVATLTKSFAKVYLVNFIKLNQYFEDFEKFYLKKVPRKKSKKNSGKKKFPIKVF